MIRKKKFTLSKAATDNVGGSVAHLHEVEAHGDQGHAQGEVHGAHDEGGLDARRVDPLAGNKIPETDASTHSQCIN